jgi:hypothetical protein
MRERLEPYRAFDQGVKANCEALGKRESSMKSKIGPAREKRWTLTLIGLGALLLISELGILEANINNRFYWLH